MEITESQKKAALEMIDELIDYVGYYWHFVEIGKSQELTKKIIWNSMENDNVIDRNLKKILTA